MVDQRAYLAREALTRMATGDTFLCLRLSLRPLPSPHPTGNTQGTNAMLPTHDKLSLYTCIALMRRASGFCMSSISWGAARVVHDQPCSTIQQRRNSPRLSGDGRRRGCGASAKSPLRGIAETAEGFTLGGGGTCDAPCNTRLHNCLGIQHRFRGCCGCGAYRRRRQIT